MRASGKRTSSHLLPNSTVIRTKLGAYALTGTQPPYMSKCNAIIAALKKGVDDDLSETATGIDDA